MKNEIDLKINAFNVSHMKTVPPKAPSIKFAIFGKPGTGKTNLMYDIMAKLGDCFPIINAFNGSEMQNKAYSSCLPSTLVSNSFDEDRLKKIINRQLILINQNHPNPWAMTIIDDCATDKKFFDTRLFRKIFKLGRHFKHSIGFLFQDALDLPREMRNSLDYVFIFSETIYKSRKLLHENYGGALSFAQFCQVLDSCTGDHKCLVIYRGATELASSYFWYKADYIQPTSLKVCSEQVWQTCEEHLDPDYNDLGEILYDDD